MESVWDYIMRRKPVFLGYFALFLVSVFASCSLLNSLIPHKADESNIVQEIPQTAPQYNNIILSPQAVANLAHEANVSDNDPPVETNLSHEISISEPTTPPDFVHVDLANPSSDPITQSDNPTENPAGSAVEPAPEQSVSQDSNNEPTDLNNEPINNSQQLAQANNTQIAEVPLTSAPRQVSIFRTILAVLLAVTALTLAGFGLYQAYDYFRPLLAKRLRTTKAPLNHQDHDTDQQ